ncbi:MAG TPA: MFS transporter [Puia sp.]|nr:MFS transporter [Puia sp.]
MSKRINTFSAFRSRNYRLYFYGQSISLIGTWMQRTAVAWVIYTLTHSTFMLGLILFASQFPSFLLSVFGGVVSDRYNRFRVLLTTQIASLVQASLLATLVLLGNYTAWEMLGLSVVLGCINAFDVPARQALMYDMIDDKNDLPNALALNATMFNLARLVGPAIAGIMLEKFGAGFCFVLNAASFIAVIGSLLMMRLLPGPSVAHPERPGRELREGFAYLRKTPAISRPILMLAAMSLLVIPFATLLPVYAKVIFHGGASTFGFINSFIGLGAIGGALFLASLRTEANRKKVLMINTLIFGAGLLLFSHTGWFPLAMVFVLLAGFGMMATTTICNTIVQTSAAPEMRGRAISYYAMAYFGMLPLGSLLVGFISQYLGVANTIMAQGCAALLIVFLFRSFLTRSDAAASPAPPTAASQPVGATTTGAISTGAAPSPITGGSVKLIVETIDK